MCVSRGGFNWDPRRSARSLSPALPRPAARLGAGRGRGLGAAAGAAQPGWLSWRVRAEQRAAPAPQRWAAQPVLLGVALARLPARFRGASAGSGPAPPRLRLRRGSPRALAHRAESSACGQRSPRLLPQAPAPAAGWMLTSGRRNPEEEEERGKKKARGRKGKNFISFSPPDTEARGRRLRQRALPREPQAPPQPAEAHGSRAAGGPTARPGCGTRRSLNATGRPSSPGRRLQS